MTPNLRFVFSALSLALTLPQIAAQSEEVPDSRPADPAVATVGRQQIRQSELLAEVNRQIPLVAYHRRVSQEKLVEIRGLALEKLVERALIHLDALDRAIEATEQEVVEEFRAALGKLEQGAVSDEEFGELLEQYRPKVIRRILLDKNEARFLAELPTVDASALAAAYEQLLAKERETLLEPSKARLLHVFVAVDPSATDAVKEEKRQEMEVAHAMLEDGKSFAEVAQLYSEDEFAERGGDMGMVTRGDIRSGILRDAAFALAEGELSPVIRSLYGFHIVRCVEKPERRLLTLEEVQPMLEEWWTTEHRKRARENWLGEIRERHPVRVIEAQDPPAASTGDVDKQLRRTPSAARK